MHLEVAPWDRSSSAKAEPGNATSPPGSAWRLERTYIHAADPQARVDDILCQLVYLDGQGHPSSNPVTLYTLSDVNGNVVALADQHGRLAAQYTYEPDGRLRSAEIPAAPATGPPPAPGEWPATIAAARLNRLGFQGLWAERIDVEGATTDTPTAGLDPLGISDAAAWPNTANLIGGSPRDTHEVLYFARNRFYSPALNRWTHADPNALGVPVLGTLWWNGGTPSAPTAHFDLTSHYADGLNTHAAYRGDPLRHRDPRGLLVGALAGVAAQAVPGPSDVIRGMYESLIGDYIANLEWDVDWATSWGYEDNWHTRGDSSWVTASLVRGAYGAFNIDLGFATINPLDAFADGGGLAVASARGPPMTPGSINALNKGLQDHHIATNKGAKRDVFERIFRQAGMSLDDPDNIVRIPHGGQHSAGYHAFIEERLKRALGSLEGDAGQRALRAELKTIGTFLRRNPDFVYNTAGGQPTRWNGLRDMVDGPSGGRLRYTGGRRR